MANHKYTIEIRNRVSGAPWSRKGHLRGCKDLRSRLKDEFDRNSKLDELAGRFVAESEVSEPFRRGGRRGALVLKVAPVFSSTGGGDMRFLNPFSLHLVWPAPVRWPGSKLMHGGFGDYG